MRERALAPLLKREGERRDRSLIRLALSLAGQTFLAYFTTLSRKRSFKEEQTAQYFSVQQVQQQ